MRAGKPSLLVLSSLVLWLSATGCSKEVKAEFPRPPATASAVPESRSEEPTPAPEPEPPAEVAEVEPEPEPEEAPESEPEPNPRPRRTPPAPAKVEPEPEPEPAPASSQLGRSNRPGAEPDPAVVTKLRRASTLLSSIERRQLSASQEEQAMAARGFVSQARKALNEGDDRRALVLIDKGLILAEDVERSTRP